MNEYHIDVYSINYMLVDNRPPTPSHSQNCAIANHLFNFITIYKNLTILFYYT